MQHHRLGGWASAVVIASALLAAPDARAQSASDKASAEALFEEGRRLMAADKAEEACPKFAASQKLDPGLGTILNLAACYEKTGKTASAWAQFREAASLAEATGDRRAEIASKRAAALEPRLSRLTIKVPSGMPAGLKVVRDGTLIDMALLGMPAPIDPGTHLIEVTAPGKKPWSTTVEVKGETAQVTAAVPMLEDAPAEPAPPPVTSVQVAPIRPDTSAPRQPQPWSTQRKIAIGAGALGLVGFAVGAGLGASAQSKWSDAQSRCPDGHCTSQADADLGSQARTSANIATAAFVVGGVGVAAAVVLWFTAPDGKAKPQTTALTVSPVAGPAATGLWLRGGF